MANRIFMTFRWAWVLGGLVMLLGLTGSIPGARSERPGAGSQGGNPPQEAHRVVLFECYETVAALHAWDRVVGISRYAYDNDLLKRVVPHLRQIPALGSAFNVNVEALLALKPDLVVTWTSKPESAEHLRRQGIPVLMFYPKTLADLYRDLAQLGQVFGKEARAREVTEHMAQSLAALQARLAGVPEESRPRVVWLWGKPTNINGNRGVIADLLQIAGGRNVGAHLNGLNQEISMETIIGLSPQVAVIWGSASYTAQDLLRDPKWSITPAVKNQRVFKAAPFSTWSPRVVVLAWWLGHCFHPQVISEADWRQAADDIYRQCYGIPYEEAP
ncbi:MAG: ABC transporter substrate-binding protein [Desulfobaccales bacterium]